MSKFVRFGNHLKELRIHLCQKGDTSKGVREFLEKHYIELKKVNPKLPVLVRECSGVQPKLWARYAMGKESSISLTNASANEVMKQIENLSMK